MQTFEEKSEIFEKWLAAQPELVNSRYNADQISVWIENNANGIWTARNLDSAALSLGDQRRGGKLAFVVYVERPPVVQTIYVERPKTAEEIRQADQQASRELRLRAGTNLSGKNELDRLDAVQDTRARDLAQEKARQERDKAFLEKAEHVIRIHTAGRHSQTQRQQQALRDTRDLAVRQGKSGEEVLKAVQHRQDAFYNDSIR